MEQHNFQLSSVKHYQHPRGIQQSQIAALAQCDWLRKAQNLLVTGPCGSGKTYIACALGHTACVHGFSTRYYRISRLMLELTQSKADGTDCKLLKILAKTDLLILDDWGLEPLKAAQRNDLMEIMDDRHGSSSTVIISQLPTEQWYEMIGNNTLADTILDRVMHNSHRFKLKGESMRKKLNKQLDPLRVKKSSGNALKDQVFTLNRNQCSPWPEYAAMKRASV